VSEFALAGTVLTRDLVAADGKLVASRGEIVDLAFLKETAARAPRDPRTRALHETNVSDSVLEAFDAAPLQHFAGPPDARAQIADGLCEVRFPDAVWEELNVLKDQDPTRFQHAVWTAVVAARLFRAAMGEAPGLSRLIGGALVHDIGMRHASPRLRTKRNHLTRAEAMSLEDHPLLGALLLANACGDSPAVHFALLHHSRAGYGYPRVEGRPALRGLDMISVASAFAAMVAPRPYRMEAFDARGAADQLCDEAAAGHFDDRAVKLLIHCLRGGKGAPREVRLPKRQTGFRPTRNNHHGTERAEAATGT
jgi:HD-GYP domain-containing protein (c-di-GMP phosphodiesterase class II)